MELPCLNFHASLIEGVCPQELLRCYEIKRQELRALKKEISDPKVLLAHKNPIAFVASFFAAVECSVAVFLANPDWGTSEWGQVSEQLIPDLIWADTSLEAYFPKIQIPDSLRRAGHIYIPTGGSSGKIRFAIHDWRSLVSSAKSTVALFGNPQLNSCIVLPLYHVSGLMPVIRAFISLGNVRFVNFQEPLPEIMPDRYVLSVVGTQLKRLLDNPCGPEWLSLFRFVFLGGGPCSPFLLKQARQHKIPLALTYGMTETASMVSVLKPEDFLKGSHSMGKALPGVTISIVDDEDNVLPDHKPGTIKVTTESLFYGYYPQSAVFQAVLRTSDIGMMGVENELFVLGRTDTIIISGGEKIAPWEVESAILNTGEVFSVRVIGQADPQWGQCVVAFYESLSPVNEDSLKNLLKNRLASYKIPKKWVHVKKMPIDEKGKLDQAALVSLLT